MHPDLPMDVPEQLHQVGRREKVIVQVHGILENLTWANICFPDCIYYFLFVYYSL